MKMRSQLLLLVLLSLAISSLSVPPETLKAKDSPRALGTALKWPNASIPFRMSSEFTSIERGIILSALVTISNSTNDCIQWRSRTNENDFVDITTGQKGCFSRLGYQCGLGPHELHIQQTGLQSSCMRKGIILSLLMRSLGFVAENNRPDRDSFLTVEWNNILDRERPRFIRYRGLYEDSSSVNICNDDPPLVLRNGDCVRETRVDTYGLDYDYGSITHFGLFYYAKDRLQTLAIKKNISKELIIGQRDSLSTLDIQKLTIAFCSNAPAPECVDTTGLCVVLKLGCWFDYVKRTCPRSCNACNRVDNVTPKAQSTNKG